MTFAAPSPTLGRTGLQLTSSPLSSFLAFLPRGRFLGGPPPRIFTLCHGWYIFVAPQVDQVQGNNQR